MKTFCRYDANMALNDTGNYDPVLDCHNYQTMLKFLENLMVKVNDSNHWIARTSNCEEKARFRIFKTNHPEEFLSYLTLSLAGDYTCKIVDYIDESKIMVKIWQNKKDFRKYFIEKYLTKDINTNNKENEDEFKQSIIDW